MTTWLPSFLVIGHHSDRISLMPGQKKQQLLGTYLVSWSFASSLTAPGRC